MPYKNPEQQKEYYQKNKEKIKEQMKKHYQSICKDKDKLEKRREEARENRRKAYWKNPDKFRQYRREWYKNHPKQNKAQHDVFCATRNKTLTPPRNCERCKKETKLEAHHYNYDKTLDVVWVCAVCHNQIHIEMKGGVLSV